MSSDQTNDTNDTPLAAGGASGAGDYGAPAGDVTLDGEPIGTAGDLDAHAYGDPLVTGDGDDPLVTEPRSRKRTLIALLVGLVIAALGAIGWTVLTARTHRRYAIAAVVVGLLIGFAMRRIAGRASLGIGIAAGLLALLSALSGSWLEMYALYGQIEPFNFGFKRSYEVLGFSSQAFEQFKSGLTWVTYFTWALATFGAFVYAIDSGKKAAPAAAGGATVDEITHGDVVDTSETTLEGEGSTAGDTSTDEDDPTIR